MKVYFAADHAGFEFKKTLIDYARELGAETEDCGAATLDPADDYPAIIAAAAQALSRDVAGGIESRAIVIGGSGQGEAIVANRFKGVRCALYYGRAAKEQTDASGHTLDVVASARQHNDANALSLGARFLSEDEAREAVRAFLSIPFSGEERHARRIKEIESQS